MSRSWRVISLVVLIAILFGAICVGVGLVTGGDWNRIYASLDARYHIDMYVDYLGQVYVVLRDAVLNQPAAEAEASPAPEAAPAPDASIAPEASPAPAGEATIEIAVPDASSDEAEPAATPAA